MAELAEELRSNEKFIEYAKGFSKNSVEKFITRYAEQKLHMEVHGRLYLGIDEREMESLISEATYGLQMIQYKKLFDLECLWRAEQIKLPGIESTWDFKDLYVDILYNKDIPDPVTESDIKFYQEFLKSPLSCECYRFSHPEYDDLKDEEYGLQELPGYFEYHNLKTGNGVYMQLPNVRGEKEDFYLSIYTDHRQKTNPPTPPRKYDPYIDTSHAGLIKVADKIGDRKFARYLRKYVEKLETAPSYELEWAVSYLCEIEDNHLIRLNPNLPWMDAIYEAAKLRQNQVVSELLPRVWEEYQMKREMNIASSPRQSIWDVDRWKEMILKGRELNGEPRNFDF